MNLELLTERLNLTPLSLADVDIALELFTDPDVVKFIGGIVNEEYIRQNMSIWIKRGGDECIGIWCVSNRATGEKYGDCYLLPMPVNENDTNWGDVIPGVMPDGDVEVGFFLKQSSWGQGIATEVCRRLVEFAFEETPLQELVATVDDENHRSKNVLEKVGFVYKGRRRTYGEDYPCYHIERKKWTGSVNDVDR